ILYVFQNNLLYAAISRLDTFSFQISYQTKTLTTAFFSVSMLNQRISARQWLSLVLLTIGVVLVQVPEWTKSQSSVFRLQRAVTPQTPNAFVEQGEVEKQEPESSKFSLSWKGQEHETSKDQGHYNYVIGITCVSIAAIISGFAGVYLERSPLSRSAYRQISSPVVLCNLYLSMYGTGFSGFLCARDWWMGKFEDWAMFHGFTSWTWGIVLNQAVGGLLVGYVIRHTDNVVKSFASSCSIVGASLISIIIFDTTPDPLMLLGGVFVLLSSHMYATSRSPPIDERKLAV
ncbi:nucleotide-sugar transporter, partial [Gonapodya prolifera JEL478]